MATTTKVAAPASQYQSLLPTPVATQQPVAAQFGNITVTQTGAGNTSQTGGSSATANVNYFEFLISNVIINKSIDVVTMLLSTN